MAEGLHRYPCRRPSLRTDVNEHIGPDLFCGVKDLVFRLTYEPVSGADIPSQNRLLGYRCPEIAAALFVAQLLDHVASFRGLELSEISDFVEASGTDLVVNEPIDPATSGA